MIRNLFFALFAMRVLHCCVPCAHCVFCSVCYSSGLGRLSSIATELCAQHVGSELQNRHLLLMLSMIALSLQVVFLLCCHILRYNLLRFGHVDLSLAVVFADHGWQGFLARRHCCVAMAFTSFDILEAKQSGYRRLA